MRIYIPATSSDVAREDILPRIVHGPTDELRSVMPREDEEVLESVAMLAAADESLRVLTALCASGESIRPLRVVFAADVPSSLILRDTSDGCLPTSLRLTSSIGWDAVESIHVDDVEIVDDIVAAIQGDDDAFERVAEEDLMWFDIDERSDLITYFS